MKVLHIFNSLMPSGAETMWVAAAPILANQGIETHVVATHPEVGPYAEVMESVGFRVWHISHHSRRLWDWRYFTDMLRMMRREKFDTVQIHPEAWRLANVVIARLAGVSRVSTTIHSCFHYVGLKRFQRSLIVRFIRLLGARIVACGESVQVAERAYGTRSILIWNWYDKARFAADSRRGYLETRRELGIPESAKVLACVGNCSSIKNHILLLKALALLPTNCWLLHVGAEDEEHTHEKKLSVALGVWDRCRFLGKRNDVARLLSASDVFVMPSLHEGLGIACIEALAMGLPAVVSDVEGLRDLAKYIPICSKASLEENIFAEKIREVFLLSGNDLADRKAQSRKIIDEMFDLKCNVAHYINLWK